ncbi:MAG TPA: SGNH/GDSL hydrolase family protein [Candidatus Omnitrophota bacterium]|nr:SGNH/GDSL hydrolase family protein [Candidatus Omnitrophota bacterium]
MKYSKIILVCIVNILCTFLLAEGCTRIFFFLTHKKIEVYRNFSFDHTPHLHQRDPVLQYKLLPSASRNAFTSEYEIIYTTNSLGLREKEISDTDKFKIIFLGDSQTFGVGVPVESRFSDLVEKKVKGIYSINAGVPGYGIHQMFLWLENYGFSLKPDLVICSIIAVDLDRAIYKTMENSPFIVDENIVSYNFINSFTRSIYSKFNHVLGISYLYSWLKVNCNILLIRHSMAKKERELWNHIMKQGESEGSKHGYRVRTSAQKKMVMEEAEKNFKNLKNQLQKRKMQLLIVNIDQGPIPWLQAFLSRENIDYLDLSGVLGKSHGITFEIDPHYNKKGHEIIANRLSEYLVNHYNLEKTSQYGEV